MLRVILKRILLLPVIGSCLILNGCDKIKTQSSQDEVKQLSIEEIEKQHKIELLNEISGVWSDDSSLVTLYYNNSNFQLLVDDKPIFVNIGDIDLDNETVNLLVNKKYDGKQVIWTLKKVQNEDGTGFTLRLTFHDGTSQSLSFVRTISNDDKQRIKNIYLENQSTSRDSISLSDYARDGNAEETLDDPRDYSESSSCEADKFRIYQRRFEVYSQNQGIPESSPEYEQSIKLARLSIQKSCAAESEAEIVGKPSFNCTKAKGYVEETICSTPELAALDMKTSYAYSSAKFFAADKQHFNLASSTWRKRRGQCSTVECIKQAYLDRIQYLNSEY